MIQTLYNGVKMGVSGPDMDNVEKLDLGYLPLVRHMCKTGLQVDLDHFRAMEQILIDDMDAATEKVRNLTGYYLNLGSADQVADLLFKKMGLKQAKKKMTPTGKRETVDDDTLTAIQHEHPVVSLIQDYREYDKLRGTYVVPMPKLATHVNFTEWRMLPNLGTTRVPSGRNNCKEPNMLAMPNRTERGRQMCEGFITRAGWCYLSVDFSQVEPRTAAHRSGDPALIAIYENDEDIYSDFATFAFKLLDIRWECRGFGSKTQHGECKDKEHNRGHGWHYPSVDKKKHRFPAKTCTLASIYEVTGAGLAEQMPVVCKNCHKSSMEHDCGKFEALWTEAKCQDIINKFYLRYLQLITMRRKDHACMRRHGLIWDDWGRILHSAAVKSVLPWVVSAALREAGNMPIQGTARGIVKLGETKAFDGFVDMRMLGDVMNPVLDIHDELLMECRQDAADEIGEYVVDIFENIVELIVPVKASIAKAECWGKMPK